MGSVCGYGGSYLAHASLAIVQPAADHHHHRHRPQTSLDAAVSWCEDGFIRIQLGLEKNEAEGRWVFY